MKNNTETESRRKENARAVMQYSLLFCILIAGIFGVLIIHHLSFIQQGDGFKQGYFWTAELKRQMEGLAAGDGISFWSWSKGTGMDVRTNYFLEPFNWLAASFPAGYIELGYTLAIVLKLYCGGLAFLAFIRYTGAGVFESLFGSICYVFSGYFIAASLVHGDVLVNVYMFPLLILSVERMYRGRSPVMFSLAAAYYVMNYFYYAYMAGIAVVIFILLRYFAYRSFSLRDYLLNLLRFIGWGLSGMCVAGVQLMVDVPELFEASSESAADTGCMLFDAEYYIQIGRKLIGSGSTSSYQLAGLSVIVILLLIAAVPKADIKRTNLIMTGFFTLVMLLPPLCRLFNGFGYPTLRWAFLLVFFAVWTGAEELGKSRLTEKKQILICFAALCALAAGTAGAELLSGSGLGRRGMLFIMIQLAGGFIFLLILMLSRRAEGLGKSGKAAVMLVLVCVLAGSWTLSLRESRGNFYRNNEINKMLSRSVQRAGNQIDDPGFYRTDQAASCLYGHVLNAPPNESLWWQTKPIYIYNSRIPEKLLELNKAVGNSWGCSSRSFVVSNDNRMGLDFLYGVKYFLGNDSKYGAEGYDEYAGYGFEPYADIDGVKVFRSSFDVSPGYVYGRYIKESEFLKLSMPAREMALMQAAVIPDDTEIKGAAEISAAEIESGVREIDYAVTETDGIIQEKGRLIAKKDSASLTLRPDEVKNSQLLLFAEGITRRTKGGEEGSFVLHASNGNRETAADGRITNQSIPGIRDYAMNLGYYEDHGDGSIKLSFSRKGNYECSGIRLYAMDAEVFSRHASVLEKNRLDVESYSDELISGSVDSDTPGILFLSVTDHVNWDIYIDDEKADRIQNVNIAFLGAEVPAGRHRVRLVYSDSRRRLGAGITLAGIIMLTAAGIYERKRRLRKGSLS